MGLTCFTLPVRLSTPQPCNSPLILIFQLMLPFLASLADLLLVVSLTAAGFGIIPASIGHILFYYLIFTLVDVAGGIFSFSRMVNILGVYSGSGPSSNVKIILWPGPIWVLSSANFS